MLIPHASPTGKPRARRCDLKNCLARTESENMTVKFPRLVVVARITNFAGQVKNEEIKMQANLAVCDTCRKDPHKMERVKRDLFKALHKFAAQRGRDVTYLEDAVACIWDGKGDQQCPPAPPPGVEMELSFGDPKQQAVSSVIVPPDAAVPVAPQALGEDYAKQLARQYKPSKN